MTRRAWYAEGWGPAKVADARLKGWEPLAIVSPLGSVAHVVSAEEQIVGEGHLRDLVLSVVAEVVTPAGERWLEETTLGRPGRVHVTDLATLGGYLDQVAGGKITEGWRDEIERRAFERDPSLRSGNGPLLTSLQFLQALDAVELWRGFGLDGEDGGEITIPRAKLGPALDAAFLAGLRIAEAEAPSQLQRAKVAGAALKRIETARKWWPAGQTWARQLIAEWPAGEKISLAALAGRMWEGWPNGPLAKRYARLKVRTLEADVLPHWRDSGAIALPSNAGEP